MDIDQDIANWIIEFLLRQPLEDRTVNSLLRALPLRNNNPNLIKLVLLRKLESEVSRHLISESMLELLVRLEEIQFQKGNETVSDSMKRAFCAVAVECTVKHLECGDGGDNVSKYKFFEAVKRVWKGRIGKMRKFGENCGLCSEMLWEWKDEIEAAVWDDCICDSVLEKKIKEVNAVEMVNVYVKEERERMGPSFLELVAMRVKNDEAMRRVLQGEGSDQSAGKEAPLCSNGGHKGKIKLRDKLVGLRRLRGAKLVDHDETTSKPLYENGNLPSSVDVKKVQEALEKSSLELKAVVKDPLPDALRLAEAISAEERRKKRQRPVEDNHATRNLFVVDDAGVVQTICDGTGNDAPRPSLMERNTSAPNDAPRPSLMERNTSAPDDAPRPSLMERNTSAHNDVPGPSLMERNNSVHDDAPRPSVMERNNSVHDDAPRPSVMERNTSGHNDAPRTSLMERNSSAHTYEWNEPINGSQEDSGSRSVLKLPSPGTTNNSPLNIHEVENLKRRRRRRKGRRWSLLEEDTLRDGVKRHGKGNWKLILTENRDIFEGRTEVDLKDKWRNLTRW